jgi:hypothetical protein
MRSAFTVAFVSLVAGAAYAQDARIYRCDDDHGVAYSDRPCGRDAVLVRGSGGATMAVAEARADMTTFRPLDAPPTGLSSRDVLARYGRPWETRVQWRNRVLTETWTWNVGGAPFRLTFRDGRVIEP